MGKVKRIYVEKKMLYAVKAKELKEEITKYLGIPALTQVRVLNRYDIEAVSEETYKKALGIVFYEPPVDMLYEVTFPVHSKDLVFSVEYLPGQFDQRADSAEQCVKLLNDSESPVIRTAVTYVLTGDITIEELERIKAYCINPVDSREAWEQIPDTLITVFEEPKDVITFHGFHKLEYEELEQLYKSLNLAMTIKDFLHIQKYYAGEEMRDPTMTEIRVLDTYWSDHCRHTTFLTELKNVEFEDGFCHEPIMDTYEKYRKSGEELHKDGKYPCLMDIALMAMKQLRAQGQLDDLEESDEINACSIVVPVEVDNKAEEWLVFFKNETHNHPTEIEPFGGAATCLGGAIRDPLSGRGYVYQAMRITGAADPNTPIEDTMKGKLPQRKIVTGAANGYSSYGNQIGLATGYVNEIYHPGYAAKRMEIGAVMGAAPRKNVQRGQSEPGDCILLLGGRTGRDGLGGATGSSKVHTEKSIETCAAEVQKGNPLAERKIQRLFRREQVSRIIKKCNDFGAGGVSVAIGELADGLRIDMDKIPKKYAGLDGTELAISESQERMAVVVDRNDVQKMLQFAKEENIEAVEVAHVTKEPRLVMVWRGQEIVNLSRAFLDTNGAHQEADVLVVMPKEEDNYFHREHKELTIEDMKAQWLKTLSDLKCCSQKGLVEMFDGSVGAGSVFMPFGGKYQLTPVQTMAAKLPVMNGKCDTVTMMSYGFDPYLSSWSPYHGSIYAILSSVAKIVASGGDYQTIRFTFQEYFKRLGQDKKRWGEPFAALLGAYNAQMELGLPSIGGKDSMSGSFQDIDVPPTLVSFAVSIANSKNVITPELKHAGNIIAAFVIRKDKNELPDYNYIKSLYTRLKEKIWEKRIKSAYALESGGICEAISKMAFGNKLGVQLNDELTKTEYFQAHYGSILAEMDEDAMHDLMEEGFDIIFCGKVTREPQIRCGTSRISLEQALEAWTDTLEKVFPTKLDASKEKLNTKIYCVDRIYTAKNKIAKPKVFMPVFPGTNCEYDLTKAFLKAGAEVNSVVFQNLSGSQIQESAKVYESAIRDAQILMLPGGFSAGDEPDGSAKFIASVFRNPLIQEAVNDLLKQRDGLVLGICNGFQALIKLGLVPYGEITDIKADSPTLTTNRIGRHISKSVHTKVVSNRSPWLSLAELGGVYAIPASHGEGRFIASEALIEQLFQNGQVATQYTNLDGDPVMDEEYNPNSSYYAIEGITSPDGRVFGKMAHSERIGDDIAINIYGEQDQKIFESGVRYFK